MKDLLKYLSVTTLYEIEADLADLNRSFVDTDIDRAAIYSHLAAIKAELQKRDKEDA